MWVPGEVWPSVHKLTKPQHHKRVVILLLEQQCGPFMDQSGWILTPVDLFMPYPSHIEIRIKLIKVWI